MSEGRIETSDKTTNVDKTNTDDQVSEKTETIDYPKQEAQEEEEKVEALGGVTRLIKEYGEGIALYGWLGTIGGICNGAAMPLFFVFFGDLITIGSEGSDNLKKDALIIMLKFFGVGFGFLAFNSLQYVGWGYFGARLSVAVRKSYFSLLLKQEVGYYDEKNSGVLNTALISDALNIAGVGTAIGQFLYICMLRFCTTALQIVYRFVSAAFCDIFGRFCFGFLLFVAIITHFDDGHSFVCDCWCHICVV